MQISDRQKEHRRNRYIGKVERGKDQRKEKSSIKRNIDRHKNKIGQGQGYW